MSRTITLIPGDGIGPEVTGAVVRILDTAGLDADWESHPAGVVALGFEAGDPLIALGITAIILRITWQSWNMVRHGVAQP